MKKQIAIIHFNTPELTEACVKSIRKHGCWWPITVFDNSDARPFTAKMRNVSVIDNTKGRYVNFDKLLASFPNKVEQMSGGKAQWPSAKHMASVQKLWELLPDGFILVESDIVVNCDISFLWDERYAASGGLQIPGGNHRIQRYLPMLCYMNVPMLTKYGVKYFDPERTFGLLDGGIENRNNWYDTGAVMLEDIRATNREIVGQVYPNIGKYYEHYRHGSWQGNDLTNQVFWIQKHRKYWQSNNVDVDSEKTAVCAMGRMENRYAVEFVKHYKKLGFDKIFIYDNNRPGEEKFEDVLSKFVKDGFVEIIPWPYYGQTHGDAFNDCYNRHNREYQWIGFFDFDEFLQLPKGKKIRSVMAEYDQADVVMVNFKVMTDGGLVTDDGRDCAKRFKIPVPEDTKRTRGDVINDYVKSLVRGGIHGIQFHNPHCPLLPTNLKCYNTKNELSRQYPLIPVTDSPIRLVHYMTKTIEEYVKHKSVRLFANGEQFDKDWLKNSIADFWIMNEKTPEKEAWLKAHKSE